VKRVKVTQKLGDEKFVVILHSISCVLLICKFKCFTYMNLLSWLDVMPLVCTVLDLLSNWPGFKLGL